MGRMARRGSPLAWAAVVVATLAAAGCGGGSSSTQTVDAVDADTQSQADGGGSASAVGTLRANYPGLPQTWEPGASNVAGYVRVPYENLTRLARDGSGEVSPELATEWKQTDDALTLTLRDDVTFHDGTAFDAEAAAKSIEFVRDGKGQYAGTLESVASVDVLDDHRLRLNLSHPTPSLLVSLGGVGVPMVSAKALEEGTLSRLPVGTGPWRYDADGSVVGTKLRFEAFSDYWDPDAINLAAVELFGIEDPTAAMNALRSGEVDVTALDLNFSDQVESSGQEVTIFPGLYSTMIFFGRGAGDPFESADARRGVCSAIDVSELSQLYHPEQFVPTNQRFQEGQYGHSSEIQGHPYDREAAERYLAAAGDPAIDVRTVVFESYQRLMEGTAAQLAEVGVDMAVERVPFPEYLSSWASGRYPVATGATNELTPYDWYVAWFAQDAPGNPAGVESEELKRAADAAIAAGTSPEAEELWAEVMRVIADEALACQDLITNQALGYESDRVQNVEGIAYEPSSLQYDKVRVTSE